MDMPVAHRPMQELQWAGVHPQPSDNSVVTQPLCQAVNNNGGASPRSNEPTASLSSYIRRDCLTSFSQICSSCNTGRPTLVKLLVSVNSLKLIVSVSSFPAGRLFNIIHHWVTQRDGRLKTSIAEEDPVRVNRTVEG